MPNRERTHLHAWANLSDETSYPRPAAAILVVQYCGFPSLGLFEECISARNRSWGSLCKMEALMEKSQEAFRYLAISLAREDIRWKENLSTEADWNGRPDPRPGDCAEGSTSLSSRLECTNGKIEACFDDHRPAVQSFRTMRIEPREHMAELFNEDHL